MNFIDVPSILLSAGVPVTHHRWTASIWNSMRAVLEVTRSTIWASSKQTCEIKRKKTDRKENEQIKYKTILSEGTDLKERHHTVSPLHSLLTKRPTSFWGTGLWPATGCQVREFIGGERIRTRELYAEMLWCWPSGHRRSRWSAQRRDHQTVVGICNQNTKPSN